MKILHKLVRYTSRTLFVPLFMLCMVVLGPVSAKVPETKRLPALHDSIMVNTSFSKRSGKIKIYSNADNSGISFTLFSQDKKPCQLFIFDISGKLVNHVQIRESETIFLSAVEKGIYMFEVFSADERIQNGNIIVR